MSFKTDMDRISQRVGGDLEGFGKAVKLEVFSSVIKNTRVDTGRARGNWQTTENTPAQGTLEDLDPSGSKSIADADKAKGIGLTYLTNNLPYIGKLEELDAMVETAIARAERIIRNAGRS